MPHEPLMRWEVEGGAVPPDSVLQRRSHANEEAGRELQATLVELVDLSLIGKQLQWNISGRPFKPLHEHLDELVATWRELSDTVAERTVALGVAPDGRAATVSAGSGIAEVDSGPPTPTQRSASCFRGSPTSPNASATDHRLGEIDLASQDL